MRASECEVELFFSTDEFTTREIVFAVRIILRGESARNKKKKKKLTPLTIKQSEIYDDGPAAKIRRHSINRSEVEL